MYLCVPVSRILSKPQYCIKYTASAVIYLVRLLPDDASGTDQRMLEYDLAHMYGFCCCTPEITLGFIHLIVDTIILANDDITVRTAKLVIYRMVYDVTRRDLPATCSQPLESKELGCVRTFLNAPYGAS